MIGVGFRREMLDWPMHSVEADFFEIVPENWLRRDRAPLHALLELGRPIRMHGVSLNLGGRSELNTEFLKAVRAVMDELGTRYYSDHLAASGDAHQLYDLFPIALIPSEVVRVSDRIKHAQDILGMQMAVENSTWYTNRAEMRETDFINEVLYQADCQLVLDVNNIVVNDKNHHQIDLAQFVSELDLSRVSYMHVAGHEYDARFDMYIDTHSQPVESQTRQMAQKLAREYGLDILLEWDNDVPELAQLNEELLCLKPSMTM